MKKNIPLQRRRYKLHQKIKHLAKYNAKLREKLVFHENDFVLTNKYIIELRDKFKYNIQLQAVNMNLLLVLETGIMSPNEVTLHRVPGKKPFAISFFKSFTEDESDLVTKTFKNKFQYVGKLSKIESVIKSELIGENFDTTNFDYHIIRF